MINEKQAKKYCCENVSLIENYNNAISDSSQIWDCHHRLEIQGQFTNSTKLLIKCGLYYNIPAWQLIFLPHAEHISLHQKGKHFSEETCQKMSETRKGKPSNFKGKQHSKEAIKKISNAMKGKNKGKHFSDKTRKKMSETKKGSFFWNNGIINKRAKECPGFEWSRGLIMKGKNND